MARHRWCKAQVHGYVCRVCGLVKHNVELEGGGWRADWYLPTSADVQRGGLTPPCVVGALTDQRLDRYAHAIANLPVDGRA